MLTDIYARSLLTATRHSQVPLRDLPKTTTPPRRRIATLLRALRLWGTARIPAQPVCQPACCGEVKSL
ncbi:hypothetical protein [Pseudophaeobacter flagellatus]|uniref:hypothetical protein n=1 Tax=Pseudophaeobacter flagellatus TaxID=2899119 RepID=UPI001E37573A|nr:hypothetical protein [Pseudophaeobacter flagellatus]MCD9148126.1 hypothetical protein [Pseudophaeobacter flagellatus]